MHNFTDLSTLIENIYILQRMEIQNQFTLTATTSRKIVFHCCIKPMATERILYGIKSEMTIQPAAVVMILRT